MLLGVLEHLQLNAGTSKEPLPDAGMTKLVIIIITFALACFGLYYLILGWLYWPDSSRNSGASIMEREEVRENWKSSCHFKERLQVHLRLGNKYKPKSYKIFGERDSGTNLIEQMVKDNFDLRKSALAGPKHLYSFNACSVVTDAYNVAERSHSNVLMILMHRSPVTWLEAMFRNHHEIKVNNNDTFTSFLTRSPFESFVLNIHSKAFNQKYESYQNIFEMRRTKLACFEEILKNLTIVSPRTELISYDYLAKNQKGVLCSLWTNHNLQTKHPSVATVEDDARPWFRGHTVAREQFSLRCDDRKALNLICENIDWYQEERFGYMKPLECDADFCLTSS